MEQIEIHNYDKRLVTLAKHIKESELSDENKKLLMDFDRALLLFERLGKPRRIKLVFTMFYLAKHYFHGSLRDLTAEEIKECIREAESKTKSPWTAANYKVAIKKFMRWLAYGDAVGQTNEVPEIVKWMKLHVRKKERHQIQASDILTEKEAQQFISAAGTARDRAFISLLYELGARIGEIGNLRIKDVSRDQYSYLIDLSGKTGHRTPRIVMADPYLTEWINQHPFNSDPSAPLWTMTDYHGGQKKMMYGSLRALVLRLKEKAGIKKRIYPHLFRHSRVTHLLMKRQLNEAQAKVYFGWTPDSDMLSEYSHLMSRDVNETILQIHGIRVDEKQEEQKPKLCPRCKSINAMEAKFCIRCSSALDEKSAFEVDREQGKRDELLNLLFADKGIQKIMLEKLASMKSERLKELL